MYQRICACRVSNYKYPKAQNRHTWSWYIIVIYFVNTKECNRNFQDISWWVKASMNEDISWWVKASMDEDQLMNKPSSDI